MSLFNQKNQITPLKVAVKYDPPMIAIFYKPASRTQKKVKTHMYSIVLNDLINLKNSEKITKKLYQEHSIHVNEDVITYEQMKQNVEILLKHQEEQEELERQNQPVITEQTENEYEPDYFENKNYLNQQYDQKGQEIMYNRSIDRSPNQIKTVDQQNIPQGFAIKSFEKTPVGRRSGHNSKHFGNQLNHQNEQECEEEYDQQDEFNQQSGLQQHPDQMFEYQQNPKQDYGYQDQDQDQDQENYDEFQEDGGYDYYQDDDQQFYDQQNQYITEEQQVQSQKQNSYQQYQQRIKMQKQQEQQIQMLDQQAYQQQNEPPVLRKKRGRLAEIQSLSKQRQGAFSPPHQQTQQQDITSPYQEIEVNDDLEDYL